MSQRPPGQPPQRGGPPPPPYRGGPPPHGPAPVPPPGSFGPPHGRLPQPPFQAPPQPTLRAQPQPPAWLSAAPPPGGSPPAGPPAWSPAPEQKTRRKVPIGLIVGLFVVVFVLATKPEILTQTLTRPLALVIALAIVAGVLLLKPLLRRVGVPARAGTAVLVVVWLLLGYFIVWRGFYEPDVFPAAANQAAAPTPMASVDAAATTSGQFRGLDGHRGSGEASLIQVAGGSFVVRFDGVNIGSGPDLQVFLVPGSGRETPDGEAVELDEAVGAYRGDHNFPVPASANVDAGEPHTVLVWCRMFQVPVAAATLP